MQSAGDSPSLWVLILEAGWSTKIILIAFLCISVWVWAVILDRGSLFRKRRRSMDRFEAAFWSGQSFEELYSSAALQPTDGMSATFVAGMSEWKRSFQTGASSPVGLQMRIVKTMDVSIIREVEMLERKLLILATLGSFSAPFLSLSGAMWGVGVSVTLAARATGPNVDDAWNAAAGGFLLTSSIVLIGLMVTVVAKIFSDKFQMDVKRFERRLRSFADEFSAILSRQIDQRS